MHFAPGDRTLRLLVLGQTTSVVGDALFEVALVWLALELAEGDPFLLGVLAASRTLPYLFLGLAGGVLADRWDRRRTVIGCDLLRGAVVLALPLLHAAGLLAFWHLCLVGWLMTSVRTVFQPALQASIPRLFEADRLAAANALFFGLGRFAQVVGPFIAGVLLAATTADVLFALDAATFGVSALCVAAIAFPPRSDAPGRATRAREELGAMWSALRGRPLVFWSLTLFGVGLTALGGLYRVGLPILAESALGGGPETFGMLLGLIGLGSAIGAVTAGRARPGRHATMIFAGWVSWGACFAALGFASDLWVAGGLALLAGLSESCVDLPIIATLQREVPDETLGKVYSYWSTAAWTGEALSGVLTGALLAVAPVSAVFLACGLAACATGVFGLAVTRPRARDVSFAG